MVTNVADENIRRDMLVIHQHIPSVPVVQPAQGDYTSGLIIFLESSQLWISGHYGRTFMNQAVLPRCPHFGLVVETITPFLLHVFD
jgi:hypothetical protein